MELGIPTSNATISASESAGPSGRKKAPRIGRKRDLQRGRTGALRALRIFTITAGILAWVLIPVGGFTLLSLQDSSASEGPAPRVWSTISVNDQPLRADAQLAIVRAEAYEVVAPSWNGLVQVVPFEVGTVLRNGQAVAVIDGVSRLAISSGRPFSRTLALGDSGDDVTRLNSVLQEQGFDAGDSEVFTRWTLSGVRALAESIGVANADEVPSFDPSWFVFLESDVPITAISLRVGSPAPAAGETIATGQPQITSARLQKRSEAGAEITTPPKTATTPDAEADVAAIAAATPNGEGLVAAEGETLFVGSQPLELAEGRDSVSLSSLTVLDSLVEKESTVVRASLESEPAAGTWLVPSAAIFTDEVGSLCALVKQANGAEPAPAPVTVLSTTKGLTIVSGPFSEGQQVLISPEKGDRRCSSN